MSEEEVGRKRRRRRRRRQQQQREHRADGASLSAADADAPRKLEDSPRAPRRTSSPIKKGEKPRSFFPTSKRKKEAAFFPPPSKVERKRQRKKKSKSPPPLSLSLYQHKRKTERCDHSGESLEESLRTSRNRINR